MSAKKTKTAAKKAAGTRKQQAAAEASALKLARLEASDPAGKAPEAKADDKRARPAAKKARLQSRRSR